MQDDDDGNIDNNDYVVLTFKRARILKMPCVKRMSEPVAVMSATGLTYHQPTKHTIHLTTFWGESAHSVCVCMRSFLLLFSLFSISLSWMHCVYILSMRCACRCLVRMMRWWENAASGLKCKRESQWVSVEMLQNTLSNNSAHCTQTMWTCHSYGRSSMWINTKHMWVKSECNTLFFSAQFENH